MSVHVLMNSSNDLGETDKMWGQSMLDSIYDMTLKLLWNCISGVKTVYFSHNVRNVVMDALMCPENL